MLLLDHDSVAISPGLIGGGFLLNLARSAIHSARRGPAMEIQTVAGGALKLGVTFGLANPAGIAFWSELGAGTLTQSNQSGPAPMIAVLGALIWGILMVALVGCGRRYAIDRVLRWIDGLCALILGWFGFRLIWNTLVKSWRTVAPTLRIVT